MIPVLFIVHRFLTTLQLTKTQQWSLRLDVHFNTEERQSPQIWHTGNSVRSTWLNTRNKIHNNNNFNTVSLTSELFRELLRELFPISNVCVLHAVRDIRDIDLALS